jgi:hypothetical protein
MKWHFNNYSSIVLCLLLVLVRWTQVLAQDECACSFQASDPADCRVYGQMGDQVLIPWYRASQDCLDVYKIKDQAIDPAILDSIYGGDPSLGEVNANALVSFLRFNGGTTVANSIKLSLDDYFEEGTAGTAVFKSQVVNSNGEAVDCGTEGDCWNALRDFFGTEEAKPVITSIGETLYNMQALSLEKEQSVIRIRLCMEGSTTECEPLSGQIQEYVVNLAETKDCSAYGLGPGTQPLPFCNGDGTTSSTGATTSTSQNTTSTTKDISSARGLLQKSIGISILGGVLLHWF